MTGARLRFLRSLFGAALVLVAAVPSALAQTSIPTTRVTEAIGKAAELTRQYRYQEAKLVLAAAQREVGGSDQRLDEALDRVDREFERDWASLKDIPQQPYLVWLYGLIPLAIGACAIAAAVLLNRRRGTRNDWRFTAYAGAVAAAILAPFYVGSAVFYFHPLPFYFRDWEYNLWEASVYLVPTSDWHRPAKGELSRRFLFICQDEEQVSFTKVKHRYRVSPQIATRAKIVFSGDSLGQGMNVSDRETTIWSLSEALNVQVFSDRKPAASLLNYPLLQENPVFVEVYAEKSFRGDLRPIGPVAYPPFQWPALSVTDAVEQAARVQTHSRYLLPHIAVRAAKRLTGDVRYWAFGTDSGAFFYSAIASEEFSALDPHVRTLAERARRVEQLGFTYVAVPVPEPESFWGEVTNARYWNLHRYFIHKAAQQGVHVVDLIPPFAEAGGHTLYQLGDGHWNGKGATLAGKTIADYIRKHRLLSPKAEQIGPDKTEPDYEREFVRHLDRHFRPDLPFAQRTCLRPLSMLFD